MYLFVIQLYFVLFSVYIFHLNITPFFLRQKKKEKKDSIENPTEKRLIRSVTNIFPHALIILVISFSIDSRSRRSPIFIAVSRKRKKEKRKEEASRRMKVTHNNANCPIQAERASGPSA